MPETPAKLIYVDDELPGITRKRSGKGWSYYDPEGKLIRDPAERKRLNAVALPPAYKDAWYCPAGNGHILATGYDDKGRKQYRYHPQFRAQQESIKFDSCVAFGNLLPLVRKRVEEDLGQEAMTKERVMASIVRLLDLGVIRIGNECYAQRNNSFGATTLRNRHAKVTDEELRLRFKGKHGIVRELSLDDENLVRVVRELQELPGQRLFRYLDDEEVCHDVCSADVNEYLRQTMGEDFTAKTFRTWHGSVLAYEALIRASENLTIKALTEEVAEKLGNTPAVTRKSYIHPAVFEVVERQEEWRSGLRLPRATRWLTKEERGFLEFLGEAPETLELLTAA